jgi:hypothetical protein
MIRLLGLVLLAYLVWLCLEACARFLRAPEKRRPVGPARSGPTVEKLVRCAACGVYFPASRALAGEEGTPCCSDECRRRAAPASSFSSS